ncbi:MAG: Rrf2 family transcriptional regulator [Pirellulales bacterium]|nr:Rrf2 family transcriptional regulator [Pirellulales bacterium]
MFSQTVEYALRAVVYLARHQQDGPIGNRVIAEATQVPTSYLSKILHDLAASGILSSRRGVGGGFQFAHSPDELSVLDVINAVDPLGRIKGCPLSLPSHCEQLCPMHARLDESLAMMEKTLGASTIGEMMFDPTLPLPLEDSKPAASESVVD